MLLPMNPDLRRRASLDILRACQRGANHAAIKEATGMRLTDVRRGVTCLLFANGLRVANGSYTTTPLGLEALKLPALP